MSLSVDYYFAPQSPWTYLGHERLRAIARSAGARIEVLPIDLGQVFPRSGGLPLAQRAPQRQAYRLVELQRFARFLDLPLNPQPRHFPVVGDDAARLIIAVDLHDGADAALTLAGAILRAVWVDERDIAAEATLAALLAEQGLAPRRLDDAQAAAANERYQATTARALEVGVFGAPSYVVAGEIFWGQDRLDFVARRLAQG